VCVCVCLPLACHICLVCLSFCRELTGALRIDGCHKTLGWKLGQEGWELQSFLFYGLGFESDKSEAL
jgi:hypothetical protein